MMNLVLLPPILLTVILMQVAKTDTFDSSDDNGAMPLVLSVFVDRILREMQTIPNLEPLTDVQTSHLRQQFKGLYAYLKEHPALMERRLFVGSHKPQSATKDKRNNAIENTKRTLDIDIAQPVCPSRTEWRLLTRAKDINDTVVRVYQPYKGTEGYQWFYTVTCANRAFQSQRDCPRCCIGIDHNRFGSSCRPKRTYVMSLIKRPWEGEYDWDWIQVETSCNCAITPHFHIG